MTERRRSDESPHSRVEFRSGWHTVAMSILLFLIGVALLVVGWEITMEALVVAGLVVGGRAAYEIGRVLLMKVRVDQSGVTVVKPGMDLAISWHQITGLEIRKLGLRRDIALKRHYYQDLRLPAPVAGIGREDGFDAKAAAIASSYRTHRPHDYAITEGVLPRKTFPFWVLSFVLVIAFLQPHPWESFWWPGHQEAVATPEPCTPILGELRAQGIETSTRTEEPESSAGPDLRSCVWSKAEWTSDGTRVMVARTIEVTYHRETRFLLDEGSSTTRAREEFNSLRTSAEGVVHAYTGLGDEAFAVVAPSSGDENRLAKLSARRANVLVTVSYHSTHLSPEIAEDSLHRLASAAIAAIRLE